MARNLDEERDVLARMIADYIEWADTLSAYWRGLFDLYRPRPTPEAKDLLPQIEGWDQETLLRVSKEMKSEEDRCKIVADTAHQARMQALWLYGHTTKEG
jgi:hypothetical protein